MPKTLIQLLLLIDSARDLNPKSLMAVAPYVAYGQQGSIYRPGEAIGVGCVTSSVSLVSFAPVGEEVLRRAFRCD